MDVDWYIGTFLTIRYASITFMNFISRKNLFGWTKQLVYMTNQRYVIHRDHINHSISQNFIGSKLSIEINNDLMEDIYSRWIMKTDEAKL